MVEIIEPNELLPGELPESDPADDQDLFEHYRIVADKGQGLFRIDKFLMSRIEGATRTRLQQAAHAGNILVNQGTVKPNYRVRPGDVITIVLPSPPREVEIIPQEIPLDIVFEDPYIMVVNKPPGLVVHPGHGNYTGTLLNAATWHILQQKGGDPAACIPYMVHRIDKNTSGLLLIAKDEITQSLLARQFANHTVGRLYHALVWGTPEPEEGTITGHVGRGQRDRRVMEVFPDGSHGKHAITHYRVLEHFGYVTLLECRLETGRTHQIRAHFRHLGHPLFNDETYGGHLILKGTTFAKYKQFVQRCFGLMPRQALHAVTLSFVHPHSGETLAFQSPLHADFAAVLEAWRHYGEQVT
jgi:23S rRNA pseudouridine1911/1915/1917 synthase